MRTVRNASELYDLLAELFGIGDYDDLASDLPYYRFRMLEASKLTRMLKKRGCKLEDVVLAAEYAKTRGKTITAAWQVFQLVPEARSAWRREQLAAMNARSDRGDLLDAAFAEAQDLRQHDWAQRLFVVDPRDHTAADQALEAWTHHKESL